MRKVIHKMSSHVTGDVTPAFASRKATITCDEQGSPEPKYWQCTRQELGRDLSAIRAFEQQKLLRVEIDGDVVAIYGRDRVGTLLLPSGRRCVIRTKIPGIVILEWLAFLGEFPDLRTWTGDGNIISSGTFQNVVAQLFLRELDLITRVHLRKGFVSFTETSQRVRGRILGSRLAQKPWQLPALPQLVRGRSLDTASNKLLALALDKLLLCAPEFSPAEQDLFQRLRSEWSTIPRQQEEQHSILQTSMQGISDGYRSALQIARLILLGAILDPASGLGGHTFTISLSRIWENAVGRMCRHLEPETQWMVESRQKCRRVWNDALGPEDPDRSLIADTILRRGKDRWVLDAKYKSSYGNESRIDRFQMCAYVLAFGARRATLVYPVVSGTLPDRRELLRTNLGENSVIVDSMAIPMAHGPAVATARLKDLLLTPTHSTRQSCGGKISVEPE